MGWSVHHPQGLLYHDGTRAFQGYTLISMSGGKEAFLVDMEGRVCHKWRREEGLAYGFLLDNGHLLTRTRSSGGGVPSANDATGILELDWNGDIVWAYWDRFAHHDFKRLPDGNTLVVCFEPMPQDIARRVQGGAGDIEEPMYGDLVREVDERRRDGAGVEHVARPRPRNRPHLPVRRPRSVAPPECAQPHLGRRPPREFPPDRYRGHRRSLDGALYVEVGAGRGFAPASPHLAAERPRAAVRQRPASRRGHVLPRYRGRPRQQRGRVGVPGRAAYLLLQLPHQRRGEAAERQHADLRRRAGAHLRGHTGREIVWEYVNPHRIPPGAPMGSGGPSSVFRAHRYASDHPALAGRDLRPLDPA